MTNNNLMRQDHPIQRGNQLRELFRKYLEISETETHYTWKSLTTENGLPNNWIYDLYQASDNKIYIGTWGGGMAVIDGEKWQIFTEKDGFKTNAITSIREDQLGKIWIGTDSGIYTLEDGKIIPCGLDQKSLLNIIIDQNQNLWAGCWRAFHSGGGLYRFDGHKWHEYTTRDGLPGQEILKVFEDSSGNIWVGTYEHGMGAGVGCFDGVRWHNYTEQDGLIDNCVYSMFEDPARNMWFGTTGGISIYDGKKWHSLTKKDGLIDNRVYVMVIDSNKKMWFGTEGGVSRLDGKNWLSFTKKDGLVENLVRAIVETNTGELWFGTYPYQKGKGGISIAKPDQPLSLTDKVLDLLPEPPKPEQLPSGDI